MQFNKNSLGLTIGFLFGIMHLLWVIVVALGSAQGLADWWDGIHFVSEAHIIAAFSLGTAVIGVVTALVSGYITGYVAAWLLNRFGKK